MFSHFLVPFSGSKPSVDSAVKAIALAGKMGADITFLYVNPDFSATSEGSLLIAMDPKEFEKRSAGKTDEVVSKLHKIASDKGIKFDTVVMVSDRPHAAIVEAAEKNGCDLIYMASRRLRGKPPMLPSLRQSQTQQVLQNTKIAVLIPTGDD